MRRLVALFAVSLALVLFAVPSSTPAAIGENHIFIHNSSNNQLRVEVHIMLPALYTVKWAAPHKTVMFGPGPMAWKGILYISVRKSESENIDTNSPQVCYTSIPIDGANSRSYTVHYNGQGCKVEND